MSNRPQPPSMPPVRQQDTLAIPKGAWQRPSFWLGLTVMVVSTLAISAAALASLQAFGVVNVSFAEPLLTVSLPGWYVAGGLGFFFGALAFRLGVIRAVSMARAENKVYKVSRVWWKNAQTGYSLQKNLCIGAWDYTQPQTIHKTDHYAAMGVTKKQCQDIYASAIRLRGLDVPEEEGSFLDFKYYPDLNTGALTATHESKGKLDYTLIVRVYPDRSRKYFLKRRTELASGVSKKVHATFLLTAGEPIPVIWSCETVKPSAVWGARNELEVLRGLEGSKAYKLIGKVKRKGSKRKLLFPWLLGGKIEEHLHAWRIGSGRKVRTLGLMVDYLEQIDALHKTGRLHGDLHGGNLYVHKGKGVLIDYGNAYPFNFLNEGQNLCHALDKRGICWTANRFYIFSPEVLKGYFYQKMDRRGEAPPLVSGKSEVWSFFLAMSSRMYGLSNRRLQQQNFNGLPPLFRYYFEGKQDCFVKRLRENKPDKWVWHPHEVLENLDGFYPDFQRYEELKPELGDTSYVDWVMSHVDPEQRNGEMPSLKGVSMDHVFWLAMHPDPERRPTASQAAELVQGARSYLAEFNPDILAPIQL